MANFDFKRAVIKVGSSLVAPEQNRCSPEFISAIAKFISQSKGVGKELILVSSGSVAAGKNNIAFNHTPSIIEKQAMAAIGQTQMMANWARLFEFDCAQILLTSAELQNRLCYVNIKNTLTTLLKNGALPIVNENDTVAINELKVGDNDNLAAYTALVAEADTLIICSDVDGLYDANPRLQPQAKLIQEVSCIDSSIYQLAGGAGSVNGTGGMLTKIQAAHKCAESGVQTLIVNGRKAEVFEQLAKGQLSGTLFKPTKSMAKARSNWIRHSLKAKGSLELDLGAKTALLQQGASLLPAGIVEVKGQFSLGEAVQITHNKQVIGQGLVQYNSDDLSKIIGVNSQHIANILGYLSSEAIIHRNDLVLF